MEVRRKRALEMTASKEGPATERRLVRGHIDRFDLEIRLKRFVVDKRGALKDMSTMTLTRDGIVLKKLNAPVIQQHATALQYVFRWLQVNRIAPGVYHIW